jgi:hypothetical protein
MQKNFEQPATPSVIGKAEILHLLQESYEREEPLVFSPSGVAISFFCLIREIEGDTVILQNPVKPAMAKDVMNSEQFFVFCRSYRIEALDFSPQGQDLSFRVPPAAHLSQERTKERTYYSEKDDAHIMIAHPFDKGTVIRRKLIDTSEGGLSFRARKMTSFIASGRTLPSLRMVVRGEDLGERSGTIVYVTRIVDPSGDSYHQVGVQFADRQVIAEN